MPEYALGARVSEVVRLRYRDFDFDRACVTIWQGKGRTDRQVTLPASFEPLLRDLAHTDSPDAFIFPGDRRGRHLSPRTVQRVVKRTLRLAGIGKAANYPLQDHIVGGWIPTPDPEDEDDPVDETVVYLVSDGQCHDMPYGPGRLWRGFRNAVTHRQPQTS